MGGLFEDRPIDLKVLDLSAGNGAVWFGDRPTGVVAVDKRAETTANVLCDTRSLPFQDDAFDLAVFDPPHTNCGPNSDMARRYGHSKMDEIRDLIRGTGLEASRCVKRMGTMALKWSDRDIGLTAVLGAMPMWRPLFGHHVVQRPQRQGHSGIATTWWMLLINEKVA